MSTVSRVSVRSLGPVEEEQRSAVELWAEEDASALTASDAEPASTVPFARAFLSPEVPSIRKLAGGRKVKVFALSGLELWAQVRSITKVLGIALFLRRLRAQRMRSQKLFSLGLFPRLLRWHASASRAVRLLSAAFGPASIRWKACRHRSVLAFALGLGPTFVRQREREMDERRKQLVKRARAAGVKARPASTPKVKNVNWDVIDDVSGTFWDARSSAGPKASTGSPTTTLLDALGLLTDPSQRREFTVEAHRRRPSLVLRRESVARELATEDVNALVLHPAQQLAVKQLFSDLTDRFASRVVAGPGAGGAADAEGGAGAAPVPPREISLLGDKKSRNLAIGLRRLGDRSFESVAKMIDAGDLEGLGGPDMVELLLSMDCYSSLDVEPVVAYERAGNDVSRLSAADRFVLAVATHTKHAKSKLECMDFRIHFDSHFAQVNDTLGTLQGACDEVRSSRRLAMLFRDIFLPIGNELNRYSNKAAALGFKLAGLATLSQTRGTGGVTLLQYVIEKLEDQAAAMRASGRAESGSSWMADAGLGRSGGGGGGASVAEAVGAPLVTAEALLKVQDELPHLREATRLTLQSVSTDVNKLVSNFKRVKRFIHDIVDEEVKAAGGSVAGSPHSSGRGSVYRSPERLYDPSAPPLGGSAGSAGLATVDLSAGSAFGRRLLPFISSVSVRMSGLQRRLDSLKEDMAGLCRFFGEDPASLSAEDILGILIRFVDEFQATRDKVREDRAKAEAAARRQREQEARQAARRGGEVRWEEGILELQRRRRLRAPSLISHLLFVAPFHDVDRPPRPEARRRLWRPS